MTKNGDRSVGPVRRTDAKLATATSARAPRWQASLTAFSRTNRTVPDYGVYAGHLAGRWPAYTDSGTLTRHVPLIYGSDALSHCQGQMPPAGLRLRDDRREPCTRTPVDGWDDHAGNGLRVRRPCFLATHRRIGLGPTGGPTLALEWPVTAWGKCGVIR
jgi:hypothetical protein